MYSQTLPNLSLCPPWWIPPPPPVTASWGPPRWIPTRLPRRASPSSRRWDSPALTASTHWKPWSVCLLTASFPAHVFVSLSWSLINLQNVCSWCAQTVFSSFGHLLPRDRGWQFHDQAWCWNEIRKCRQTWWWPNCCHKWAWLAYLLTLQNANLMGPMSGWFKDVCSGWCLQIVPQARALCCWWSPSGSVTRFIRVSPQTVWDMQVWTNWFWCEGKKMQMQQTVLVLKWLLLLIFHVSYFTLPPSAEIDQHTFIKTQE